MSYKISIIVGVYKTEQYLRQCLDSIVNQTYQNLELILIDDASPDNGGLICDEYARIDNRVVVIHKEENEGVYAGWNDGIKRATGEWITFIDSDDWIELDYFEQLFKALNDRKLDIFCAGGGIFEYTAKQKKLRTFPEAFQLKGEDVKKLMIEMCCSAQHVGGDKEIRMSSGVWDKLYNSMFIRKNGLLFESSNKIKGDFWFNFQAFNKADSVATSTYIGYHYRQATYVSSYTRGYHEDRARTGYDIICKLYGYVGSHRDISSDMLWALRAQSIQIFVNVLNVCYFHPANPKSYKEISREIRKVKKWPYFHEAIYGRGNKYLSKKQIVLKYFLRLPWVWPVKLLWMAKQKLSE